jgi:hypothetical protein
MATTTTKKSTTQKTTKKKKDVEEVNSAIVAEESAKLKQMEEENASLKKQAEENDLLRKQLDDMAQSYKNMQLQLQNLLLTQKNNNVNQTTEQNGSAKVGCRMFNGATLISQGGDISIPIEYNEEVDIEYAELREIFKNPFGYKSMFRKGILYFVNPQDYARFNIKPEVDLSEEALTKLLNNSNAFAVTDRIKEITKDKKDLASMFTVIYQIASLIDKKKVDLDYDIRSALEKYFEVDFKTLINNLHQ